MSDWSQHLARQILGIPSPSRQWRGMFDPEKLREAVERGACESWAAPPWYAVRGPRSPYEWPELRRQARVLRRLIRRNWYVLMTDPKAPVSIVIQVAMMNPPKRPRRSVYDEMRQLLDAGKIQVRPEAVAEWMKEFHVQTEERS